MDNKKLLVVGAVAGLAIWGLSKKAGESGAVSVVFKDNLNNIIKPISTDLSDELTARISASLPSPVSGTFTLAPGTQYTMNIRSTNTSTQGGVAVAIAPTLSISMPSIMSTDYSTTINIGANSYTDTQYVITTPTSAVSTTLTVKLLSPAGAQFASVNYSVVVVNPIIYAGTVTVS